MSTSGENLLLAILRDKSIRTFLEVPAKHYSDKGEIALYNFIRDYYKKYSDLPTIEVAQTKFGYGEVTGKLGFYVNEVQSRYIYMVLGESLPKYVKNLRADPKKVLENIKDMVSGLTLNEFAADDLKYFSSVIDRYTAYEDRIDTGGVTYLSTGCPLLDRITFGYRKNDLWTIGGRAGTKKCFGEGTLVRMWDLSVKPVEYVEVGDKVLGPDGKPRTVVDTYRDKQMMYWVHQKKGDSYRVNEDHILSLRNRSCKNLRETVGGVRRYVGSQVNDALVNISVKDYLTKSKFFKKNHKGWKPSCMDFGIADYTLPVDPYFLGLWLGDGNSNTPAITTIDAEVIKYLNEFAESWGMYITPNKITYALSPYAGTGGNKLKKALQDLGVLCDKRVKAKRGKKHIPTLYLKASAQDRLKLLAGLIDSDGGYSKGNFSIAQKSTRLADDIRILACSLGFHCSLTSYVAELKSANYRRKCWNCIITGDIDKIPTIVSHKKAHPRRQIKNWLVTGIEVVPDKVDTFYGFTIDGDNLFCLQDFTVVHNTWQLIYLTLQCEKALPESYGPIMLVSNEMGLEEIGERMDAIRYKLSYERLQAGELTDKEEKRYRAGSISSKKRDDRIIMVFNCSTLEELNMKIRIYQPSIVFLDGSYLLEPQMEEGIVKTTFITRNLKQIAKNEDTPIVNTTQLRKKTGKRSMKSTLDGQDEFFYGSYVQDSDLAIRTFVTPEMKYYQQIGMEMVKARRSKEAQFIWNADLDKMEFNYEVGEEEIETLAEPTSKEKTDVDITKL